MTDIHFPRTAAALCILGIHTKDIEHTLQASLKSFETLRSAKWDLRRLPQSGFGPTDLCDGVKWLLDHEYSNKFILLLGHGKAPTLFDGHGSELASMKAPDTGALIYKDIDTGEETGLAINTLLGHIGKYERSDDKTITIRPYTCHNYAWDKALEEYKTQQRIHRTAIVNIVATTIGGTDLTNHRLAARQFSEPVLGPSEVTNGDAENGHLDLRRDVSTIGKK